MPHCYACKSENVVTVFDVKSWIDINAGGNSNLAGFVKAMQANDNFGINKFCRCGSCGFTFANPYPSDQALNDFYASYYANENYASKIDKKLKRAGRRIRKLIKPGYKTFLDVGCNIGAAVEAARLAGLEATGIEIDPAAVKKARDMFPKNRYKISSIQDFNGGTYDIIYTAEVIEHISDIDGFTSGLYRLLNPGGILYLTTPDAGHFRRPKDIRIWNELKLPEHISLFSGKAIKTLLKRHGFENIRISFNLKPGLRLKATKRA